MSNKYDEIMQRLNAKPVTLDGQPIMLSETQLDKMESDLGFSVPTDFREFLKNYGSYGLNKAALFPLRSGPNGMGYRSIETLVGLGPNENMSQDDYYGYLLDVGAIWELQPDSGVRLVRSYADDVEAISWPKELLPIGEDAGCNIICLALGGLRPGAVFCWLISGDVYLAADSFDEFMQSLFLSN